MFHDNRRLECFVANTSDDDHQAIRGAWSERRPKDKASATSLDGREPHLLKATPNRGLALRSMTRMRWGDGCHRAVRRCR
ncbi:MAG: hypothetical protein ACYC7F_02595 [Gemmatimonadaceae bacterium]